MELTESENQQLDQIFEATRRAFWSSLSEGEGEKEEYKDPCPGNGSKEM